MPLWHGGGEEGGLNLFWFNSINYYSFNDNGKEWKYFNDKILILKDVMIKTVSLLYRDKKNISSINEIVQVKILN